jgi:pyruvate, orthophosphate dikinase
MSNQKILIVEEDIDLTNIIKNHIKTHHQQFEVSIVNNGKSAIETILNEDKPLHVILDIVLPDMSGLDVFEAYSEKDPMKDTPFIFYIDPGQEKVQTSVLDFIANEESVWYLSKPFVTNKLDRILKKISNSEKFSNRYKPKSESIIDNVSIQALKLILSKQFDAKNSEIIKNYCHIGTPISPGAASGKLYFNLSKTKSSKSVNVILYMPNLVNINLADLRQLNNLQGVLCNEIVEEDHTCIDLKNAGIPIVKIPEIKFSNGENESLTIDKVVLKEGECISFNGSNGRLYNFEIPTKSSIFERSQKTNGLTTREKKTIKSYHYVIRECDRFLKNKIEVTINADTPEMLKEARELYGVKSVGLLRTENILKENKNNFNFWNLILSIASKNQEMIKEYSKKFKISQLNRFTEMLSIQGSDKTQIRLLDPSYDIVDHSLFLQIIEQNKSEIDHSSEMICSDILSSPENYRGVKLINDFPEIYKAQLEMLYVASSKVKNNNLKVFIPYVNNSHEVYKVKEMSEEIARKYNVEPLDLGITLETQNGIALGHEFISTFGIINYSIGTNDLLTLLNDGNRQIYSRTDKGVKIAPHIASQIHGHVKKMILQACKEKSIKDLSIGIAGEMNSRKLEDLQEIIPYMTYISAGSTRQIPELKLAISKTVSRMDLWTPK